jgi:hypothetical protein
VLPNLDASQYRTAACQNSSSLLAEASKAAAFCMSALNFGPPSTISDNSAPDAGVDVVKMKMKQHRMILKVFRHISLAL